MLAGAPSAHFVSMILSGLRWQYHTVCGTVVAACPYHGLDITVRVCFFSSDLYVGKVGGGKRGTESGQKGIE